ncbi:MAG: hypothetical protein ACLQJ7_17260 [Syntrophobacteraceae bacterium]
MEGTAAQAGSLLFGSIGFINPIFKDSAETALPLPDIEGKDLIAKELSSLKTGVSKRLD